MSKILELILTNPGSENFTFVFFPPKLKLVSSFKITKPKIKRCL